ncbi:MAG: peptidoglycan-associated lipoprotein Pal [Steroidobacteraceae bacterium]
MRISSLAVLVVSVASLAACSTPKVAETPAPESTTPVATTAPATTTNVGAGQQLTAEQLAKQAVEKIGMVIYFDYDSSELKPEYNAVVAAHAKYLATNGNLKARLEGNTDERGSREYNIGLGERRAQAVRRALLLQGVSEAQLTTLSYGEERPAVTGSDEAAYAKNRRVEFGY